jgi:uncharacterized protein related to proFAR isomerase
MKNEKAEDLICQCRLDMFGDQIHTNANVNILLKHMKNGLKEFESKKKWAKERVETFELIKIYLEIRKDIANERNEKLSASNNFCNLLIKYCLLETYHNKAKKLFWIEDKPIVFVKSSKIETEEGFNVEIPINQLSEDDLNSFIFVY